MLSLDWDRKGRITPVSTKSQEAWPGAEPGCQSPGESRCGAPEGERAPKVRASAPERRQAATFVGVRGRQRNLRLSALRSIGFCRGTRTNFRGDAAKLGRKNAAGTKIIAGTKSSQCCSAKWSCSRGKRVRDLKRHYFAPIRWVFTSKSGSNAVMARSPPVAVIYTSALQRVNIQGGFR